MPAGDLDQQIFFQSPSETNDGGELKNTWVNVGGDSPLVPDWAKVISQKGSETFESVRTNAKETIRVKCRYRSDVKTTWRMKWNDQFYNILYVDRSQRREGYLWFTAELVGAS